MVKQISCLALSVVLVSGIFVQQVTATKEPEESTETAQVVELEDQPTPKAELPAEAEQDAQEEQTAVPEGPQILVDGAVLEDINYFVYEQVTYVSLRSVTQALRPDAVVSWEGDHASVTASGLTITAYPYQTYLVANGRYLYLPYGVRYENNAIMVPVRELAEALGAQVWWDANDKNTYITSGTGAIVSGDEFYNADDVYWLSRIINAESGNQSLEGKLGVGNVILNRVNSASFPNTIYGVIFQRSQFTPASNGAINKTPNQESIIAAKLCLDGAVVLPSAMWFNSASSSSWASRNKSYVTTIGAHAFYA
jgi:N-acetylmuramoyl-L-alanine amidase